MLEHTDPGIVIVQVPEIPDSRTYTGHEGLIDAFLDRPRQWEDFRMETRRIFSADPDHFVVIALHKGQPLRQDAEGGADGDDDHAAERDGGKRAQEARAEELRTDHR